MKVKYIISILFIMLSSIGFSQNEKSKTEKGKHGNLGAYLIELEQISGFDNIKHIDSISGYKITIPLWWKIIETPNTSMFGGTFPKINGIQNALLFKVFDKNTHKNLKKFEKWVITDYKMGDKPKWSSGHTILLKQEVKDFSEIGNSYKVQLMRNGKIYVSCYIIVETSNSYLWIDFTATKETYEVNYPKLKELLNSYRTL